MLFYFVSGLKVNIDESEILQIGKVNKVNIREKLDELSAVLAK